MWNSYKRMKGKEGRRENCREEGRTEGVLKRKEKNVRMAIG